MRRMIIINIIIISITLREKTSRIQTTYCTVCENHQKSLNLVTVFSLVVFFSLRAINAAFQETFN